VRRKRTPAATSLARAASEFFHDDGLESGAPACVSADVLTNRLWLKRPTKSPDLPRRRLIADAYAATLPDEKLWTRFVEEVEKLRTAGRIKPDEYYILRSSLESREALMAHTLGDGREGVGVRTGHQVKWKRRMPARSGSRVRVEFASTLPQNELTGGVRQFTSGWAMGY
jgi:hypothetical protein